MGLFEAKGQLDRAMKDLGLRWMHTQASWRDTMAKDFEEKHLVPLQAHVRTATAAMSTAASLTARVRQDCA